jgi:ABC-type Fe3+ transport system permease subunit
MPFEAFTPFVTKVHDTRSIPTFVVESVVFAVAGLVLGVAIDRMCIYLNTKYPNYKLSISIFQIVISAIVIAFGYLYLPKQYTSHFQRTLPGLAFPALFYGVQSNIYSTWQGLGVKSAPVVETPIS